MRRHPAISLAAAATEIRRGGYDGLSIDRVAEQAGVARTTLYRRWPSKAELVVALIANLREDVPFEPLRRAGARHGRAAHR